MASSVINNGDTVNNFDKENDDNHSATDSDYYTCFCRDRVDGPPAPKVEASSYQELRERLKQAVLNTLNLTYAICCTGLFSCRSLKPLIGKLKQKYENGKQVGYDFDNEALNFFWTYGFIVLDFDNDKAPLLALIDLRKFLIDYNLNPNQVIVYFSGNKGFHLYIPCQLCPTWTPCNAKLIAEYLKKTYTTLDASIYNANRGFREVGSYNAGGEAYKQRLANWQVDNLINTTKKEEWTRIFDGVKDACKEKNDHQPPSLELPGEGQEPIDLSINPKLTKLVKAAVKQRGKKKPKTAPNPTDNEVVHTENRNNALYNYCYVALTLTNGNVSAAKILILHFAKNNLDPPYGEKPGEEAQEQRELDSILEWRLENEILPKWEESKKKSSGAKGYQHAVIDEAMEALGLVVFNTELYQARDKAYDLIDWEEFPNLLMAYSEENPKKLNKFDLNQLERILRFLKKKLGKNTALAENARRPVKPLKLKDKTTSFYPVLKLVESDINLGLSYRGYEGVESSSIEEAIHWLNPKEEGEQQNGFYDEYGRLSEASELTYREIFLNNHPFYIKLRDLFSANSWMSQEEIEKYIRVFQDICTNCILQDEGIIYICHGRPGTAKSALHDAVSEFFDGKVLDLTIHDLGYTHGLTGLTGMVATRFNDLTGAVSLRAQGNLKLLAGDYVKINPKNKTPYIMKAPTVVLISCNEIPKMYAVGIERRALYLELHGQIKLNSLGGHLRDDKDFIPRFIRENRAECQDWILKTTCLQAKTRRRFDPGGAEIIKKYSQPLVKRFGNSILEGYYQVQKDNTTRHLEALKKPITMGAGRGVDLCDRVTLTALFYYFGLYAKEQGEALYPKEKGEFENSLKQLFGWTFSRRGLSQNIIYSNPQYEDYQQEGAANRALLSITSNISDHDTDLKAKQLWDQEQNKKKQAQREAEPPPNATNNSDVRNASTDSTPPPDLAAEPGSFEPGYPEDLDDDDNLQKPPIMTKEELDAKTARSREYSKEFDNMHTEGTGEPIVKDMDYYRKRKEYIEDREQDYNKQLKDKPTR